MTTTKKINTSLYTRMKLRQIALLTQPVKDYEPIVCCLETRILEKLNRISMNKKILKDKLVDEMVMKYAPNQADNFYLNSGIYKSNFVQNLSTFFSIPEERQFVTFQTYKDTLGRLNSFKNFYGLNKSTILKYIILKYIKENNL